MQSQAGMAEKSPYRQHDHMELADADRTIANEAGQELNDLENTYTHQSESYQQRKAQLESIIRAKNDSAEALDPSKPMSSPNLTR